MSETVLITPNPHLLDAYRNESHEWKDVLAELIDNAFDAKAKRVEFTVDRKSFRIQDDGVGMADVTSAVTFGKHSAHGHASTREILGRYGIGAKGAALWMSDNLHIVSNHQGVVSELAVDWRQVEKSQRWEVAQPTQRPATASDPLGTVITCAPLRGRHAPLEATLKALGLTFMPALNSGLQIIANLPKRGREIIRPAQLPLMNEPIVDRFEIDGREVSIHIGIRADNTKPAFERFAVCYGHRCLDCLDIGTKEYNSSRMSGKIELGKGWKLHTFKNGASDLHLLEDPIFQRIEKLLKQADQMARVIHCDGIRAKVETAINESLETVKEKRPGPKGQNEGTVKPKNTGIKRRRASHVDTSKTGSVVSNGGIRRSGIVLHFFEGDGESVGNCSTDNTVAKVNLDANHPTISTAIKEGNGMSLMCISMFILAAHDDQVDESQRRLFGRGDLVTNYSRAIKAMNPEAFK